MEQTISTQTQLLSERTYLVNGQKNHLSHKLLSLAFRLENLGQVIYLDTLNSIKISHYPNQNLIRRKLSKIQIISQNAIFNLLQTLENLDKILIDQKVLIISSINQLLLENNLSFKEQTYLMDKILTKIKELQQKYSLTIILGFSYNNSFVNLKLWDKIRERFLQAVSIPAY